MNASKWTKTRGLCGVAMRQEIYVLNNNQDMLIISNMDQIWRIIGSTDKTVWQLQSPSFLIDGRPALHFIDFKTLKEAKQGYDKLQSGKIVQLCVSLV